MGSLNLFMQNHPGSRITVAGMPIRWASVITLFILVAGLDFLTPPNYILADLYIVPILISVSFLTTKATKILLYLAVAITLLNIFFPQNVSTNPAVVVNRIISAATIIIATYFMVRYVRYQNRLREKESQLLAQQVQGQMREDFVAMLTHDLKTPLLGEVQTLHYLLKETRDTLNADQQEMLEILQRGAQRQLDMVETLVLAYRNDSYGVELRLTSANLDELMADILIEVQSLARAREITLDYSCGEAPPVTEADPLQIKRVLANLIHNALNYTPPGGRIQIVLSQRLKELLIEVSDTGPGIPEKDLDAVFTRIYKSGDKRQIISTGLGLYLSRQIVMAHRGQIWAKNLHPNGCRFSFTLPIAHANHTEDSIE